MNFTRAEIMKALEPVGPVLRRGADETPFKGLSTDTRTIRPDQLFVPLIGEKFDGHDYLDQAIEAGASGVLVQSGRDREVWPGRVTVILVPDTLVALGLIARAWREELGVKLLAISGSMGKSTVKEMTAEILGVRYSVHKNKGNLNNLIGLPLTLLEMGPGVERAVVELGINQIGEMERLAEIAQADAALLTNIGPVHLEGLGGMEGIVRAKTELWRRLKPGALALVNLNDEILREVSADLGAEKLTFGTAEKSPGAEVLLRRAEPNPGGGLDLVLEAGGKVCETTLTALGRYQGLNALAAAAGAYSLGAGLDEICEGLAEFRTIDHRMKLLQGRDGLTILDDSYNANPLAMAEALAALGQAAPKGARRFAVLGQMAELGPIALSAHRELGRQAAKHRLDGLIVLGPFAAVVAEEAYQDGLARVYESDGIAEAEERLMSLAQSGDYVLIKGSRVAGLERLVARLREAE